MSPCTIFLKEEISLSEASLLYIDKREADVDYGAKKIKSKLARLKTKIGSYVSIFSEDGNLITDASGDGTIPGAALTEDNDRYGNHTDQYGYEYMYLNIYLSKLPPGKYKMVISRSGGYESTEFEFII